MNARGGPLYGLSVPGDPCPRVSTFAAYGCATRREATGTWRGRSYFFRNQPRPGDSRGRRDAVATGGAAPDGAAPAVSIQNGATENGEWDMRGDRVEIVIDAGSGTTRTYDVVATRAGRKVTITHGRGVVEVAEVTRGGNPVRTARFLANRVLALVEHPAVDEPVADEITPTLRPA